MTEAIYIPLGIHMKTTGGNREEFPALGFWILFCEGSRILEFLVSVMRGDGEGVVDVRARSGHVA